MNIPAIGFSPMFITVARLHDHNEYINAETYLAGIEVYQIIVLNIELLFTCYRKYNQFGRKEERYEL